jgi:hypothetical protein
MGKMCDRTTCTFAHNASELRFTDMFYKTRLCSFVLKGLGHECAAFQEGTCRFAHSPEELRSRVTKNQLENYTKAPMLANNNTMLPSPPFPVDAVFKAATAMMTKSSNIMYENVQPQAPQMIYQTGCQFSPNQVPNYAGQQIMTNNGVSFYIIPAEGKHYLANIF